MRPIVLVPLLVAFASAVGCQRESAELADTTPSPAATPSTAPELRTSTPADTEFAGRGSIASVDRSAGTVTLDSEPIADLGWSSRTVTLAVADDSLGQELEPGAVVDFTLLQDKAGRLVVSSIEPGTPMATAENDSE